MRWFDLNGSTDDGDNSDGDGDGEGEGEDDSCRKKVIVKQWKSACLLMLKNEWLSV